MVARQRTLAGGKSELHRVSVMGNAHLRQRNLADGSELQRRVGVKGCDVKIPRDALGIPGDHFSVFGLEVKRGNLCVEQGEIGDERISGAQKVSGKLLECRG